MFWNTRFLVLTHWLTHSTFFSIIFLFLLTSCSCLLLVVSHPVAFSPLWTFLSSISAPSFVVHFSRRDAFSPTPACAPTHFCYYLKLSLILLCHNCSLIHMLLDCRFTIQSVFPEALVLLFNYFTSRSPELLLSVMLLLAETIAPKCFLACPTAGAPWLALLEHSTGPTLPRTRFPAEIKAQGGESTH